MNAKKRLATFFFPALVAGLFTWVFRYSWDRWVVCPVAEFPQIIDLGEREWGEVAVGRFTIANRGLSELIVDEFMTSCSCAGVEQELEGKRQRVECLRVPAGEAVEVSVRVAIGAPPGESQHVRVAFTTNDPARPSAILDVDIPRVKGGVYPLPTAVLLGQVRAGSSARQVIALYDNGHPGRRIGKVRSLQPERFDASLLPIPSDEQPPTDPRLGRLIGRLEVRANTAKAGPLNGAVEICLEGEARRPDIIPVLGEVVEAVECNRSVLVLPRRSGKQHLSSGQLLLRHRDGKPISIEVESPAGFSAVVHAAGNCSSEAVVHVECADSLPPGQRQLRLHIRADAESLVLNVPLFVTNPSPAEALISEEQR